MNTSQQEEPAKKGWNFKKVLQVIIPLALGVVILWLLYRGTNFTEMWQTIKDANFAILLFSLIFGLFGNIIRGFRWKLLIEPLGYNPRTSNLVHAVLGNYAVNFILPRAGEVWRCGVIAKDEKIPFTKLLGTLLLDRVFDTLAVIIIVLLACSLNVDFFINYLGNNQAILDSIITTLTSWKLYGGLFAVILFFVLIFTVFKQTTIVIKVKQFFIGIITDMKSVWK